MPSGATTAVVLDNEAVQALADPAHPKHRRLLEVLAASGYRRSARVLAPTAVRVEARAARGPREVLGRFHVEDVPLTSARADAAIRISSGTRGSAVDATVAQVAEEAAAAGAKATVYTSDLSDIQELSRRTERPFSVTRI